MPSLCVLTSPSLLGVAVNITLGTDTLSQLCLQALAALLFTAQKTEHLMPRGPRPESPFLEAAHRQSLFLPLNHEPPLRSRLHETLQAPRVLTADR